VNDWSDRLLWSGRWTRTGESRSVRRSPATTRRICCRECRRPSWRRSGLTSTRPTPDESTTDRWPQVPTVNSARPRTDSASAERNKIGRVVQSADKLMFCLCDIFSHFWRFCQTNYFNTYLTDLRQIFRFGTSMAAWMNDLKISFSLPQETFSWQAIL